MPKKYGVKEKDLVVSHVVNMVLTGKLRSGDRLDRNEIAHELGLSRVPVQEAVVQLEHDGILSTRYHRGAYVERFDEATVREHHELYGLREREARQWLERRAPGAEWLAVDDAPGNWPTRARLVLTDFKQGFTEEDAGRMRRLLDAFRSGEFKAPEAAV